jgi:hypothetical protein
MPSFWIMISRMPFFILTLHASTPRAQCHSYFPSICIATSCSHFTLRRPFSFTLQIMGTMYALYSPTSHTLLIHYTIQQTQHHIANFLKCWHQLDFATQFCSGNDMYGCHDLVFGLGCVVLMNLCLWV